MKDGPDRRHWLLGRRRDDAASRGLEHGDAGGRLGRRGRALVREDLIRGPRGWFAIPEAAVQTAAVAVMSGTAPPPSLEDLVPRISPRPVFLIYAGRGGGGEELTSTTTGRPEAEDAWKIEEAGHVGGFEARPGSTSRA